MSFIKVTKKCLFCGKNFETDITRDRKYCSHSCSYKDREKRRKEVNKKLGHRRIKLRGPSFKTIERKRKEIDEYLKNKNMTDTEKKIFKDKYISYYKTAKEKNYPFWFKCSGFEEIIKKKCYYCGSKQKLFNGIDRINSSIGYTRANSVPCCSKCNRAKWTMSLDEFAEHILKLQKWAENFIKKNKK